MVTAMIMKKWTRSLSDANMFMPGQHLLGYNLSILTVILNVWRSLYFPVHKYLQNAVDKPMLKSNKNLKTAWCRNKALSRKELFCLQFSC